MTEAQQHSLAVDSMKLSILTKHERAVNSAFLTPPKSPLPIKCDSAESARNVDEFSLFEGSKVVSWFLLDL
jgi:hypothetical protein